MKVFINKSQVFNIAQMQRQYKDSYILLINILALLFVLEWATR